MKINFALLLLFIFLMPCLIFGSNKMMKLTIVFDNYNLHAETKTNWGFACVMEFPDENILFDTGNDSTILLYNLEKLGFADTKFSKIVISHMHWDHIGGLQAVLKQNSQATVFLPASASEEEKKAIEPNCQKMVLVKEPKQIHPNLWSIGELSGQANEQSLALVTKDGTQILTGCAHPGIENIVKRAKEVVPELPPDLILGGFHLLRDQDSEIKEKIEMLKNLGVRRAAPTHCTGDKAIEIFAKEFSDNFIKAGVGLSLDFELE